MLPTRRLSVRTIIKSAGVGAIATVADLTVLTVLVSGFAVSARTASPFALIAGLGLQFVGNKLFAFQDRRAQWGRQAALFFAIEALAFCANLALFDVAVRLVPLPYVLVRVMTQAIVYFGLCLPLWSRVFTNSPAALKEVAS